MEKRESIRELQLEALDVLKELDRVCKELNIPYFITAGTLLGAVRHKGFIPWDDDVDIVMKRQDYERFRISCPALLEDSFFFQDHHTEPAYPLGFAKLRKRGLSVTEKILQGSNIEMGVFVDIFPLDACPQNKTLAKIFFYGNTIVSYGLIWRCNPAFALGSTRKLSQVLWKLARKMPNRWLFRLRDLWRRLAALCSDGTVLCTVSGRHGYPRESYPAQWFSEEVMLPFEDSAFPAPAQWHELLTNMYGSYMTPVRDMDSHIE